MSAAPVSMIITMTGPDRPGLVESLSTTITEAGGNWEGARMARLSGHFAGVVHVVISRNNIGELKVGLDSLDTGDLHISAVEESGTADEPNIEGTAASLHVIGQDRSGIVKEISHALAELGVNVQDLSTECGSAPMSAERLFDAHAEIVIPEHVTMEKVQEQIEDIAHDLAVTITASAE